MIFLFSGLGSDHWSGAVPDPARGSGTEIIAGEITCTTGGRAASPRLIDLGIDSDVARPFEGTSVATAQRKLPPERFP